MKNRFYIFLIVVGLALALAGCGEPSTPEQANAPGAEVAEGGEKKEREILYWVAPMDPNYRRDEPGKSPMGMDLIPVYADGEDAGAEEGGPVVKISPAVVNNLGVRTALSERGRLWRRIDTVGYVDYDETKISHVHLRTDGWIERLFVKAIGDRVNQGEPLFELYSPTLVNAQEEYVQALYSGDRALIRASRDRLESLYIPEERIKALAKTRRVPQRVTIYAAQDGIVRSLNVREGMYAKPALEVLSLGDLSTVWVLAEVFESQSDWVKAEQPADVRLSYLPGREWEGRVQYIYPDLDPKTRTLKVRLRFDNPDEVLKPNMYADLSIYGGPKDDVVMVPREALIRSGKTERLVIDLGEGRYQAREVKAGMESGDWVEVVAGLNEGERVVVSGQFLIDSEASLKASLMRMGEAQAPAPEPAIVTGAGKVKQVMAEQRKLNLEHEPIPELGWPAMTMDFRLAEGVDTSGLTSGDVIDFELEDTGEGYVISSFHKRSE